MQVFLCVFCYLFAIFYVCLVAAMWMYLLDFLTAEQKSVMGTALGLDSHVACVQRVIFPVSLQCCSNTFQNRSFYSPLSVGTSLKQTAFDSPLDGMSGSPAYRSRKQRWQEKPR